METLQEIKQNKLKYYISRFMFGFHPLLSLNNTHSKICKYIHLYIEHQVKHQKSYHSVEFPFPEIKTCSCFRYTCKSPCGYDYENLMFVIWRLINKPGWKYDQAYHTMLWYLLSATVTNGDCRIEPQDALSDKCLSTNGVFKLPQDCTECLVRATSDQIFQIQAFYLWPTL